MTAVMIISIVIVFAVILLSAAVTSLAYSYKHKVDPADNHPDQQTYKRKENRR